MDAAKNKLYVFLRSLEKYTKTDMVYLAQGGFWLSLKTVAAALLALGLSIAFANLVPQHIFGEYKYVFSLFALLTIPTLLGMGIAVTKSVSQGYEGTPLAALKTKIKWGVLGSLASVAIALYYYTQGNTNLAGAFGIVAIFLPFVDTLNLFNATLTGKQLFKISTIYEVVIQLISVSVIVVTLFFTDNLFLILLAYFSIYTLTRFIAFRLVNHFYKENDTVDASAIRYGKHLTVMRILGIVAATVDSILIWQFAGAVPLAVYSFAKAIPTHIASVLRKVVTLALPRFANRDLNQIKETLPFRLFQMTAVIIVIVVAYVLAAPHIFNLLFPQYTEAIVYSQIFALTLLFFPKKIIGTVLNAHERTKELYINSTATPIVKLILLGFLIPSFGILGAIIAEIVTQIFSLILLSILLIRARA